ncbi:antitoxin [Corynebacterium incognita]|uniref:Antitoxin n=1 Tax=Corynebacterium incognita TaxID=2754725 RepID=A0A7G7CPL2_9CORY|nr:antitoxin [Corynebacterium incognita]QNE89528.1 antitoxin [Corynebacterium incognita]
MGIFDKAKDAMNSDKGEQISDSALDKGVDAANQKFGDQHADKIDKAREAADGKLGNE